MELLALLSQCDGYHGGNLPPVEGTGWWCWLSYILTEGGFKTRIEQGTSEM